MNQFMYNRLRFRNNSVHAHVITYFIRYADQFYLNTWMDARYYLYFMVINLHG